MAVAFLLVSIIMFALAALVSALPPAAPYGAVLTRIGLAFFAASFLVAGLVP